jgi:hypothetical protein
VYSVNSVVRNCFCCKAVRTVNQHFSELKIEQAPDKTFIGKISGGWDFLGYHFDGTQLTVAAKTVEKHVLHYRQLYEQLSMKKATSVEMALALGWYVKRWQRWAVAGLQGFKIDVYAQIRYPRAPIQILQNSVGCVRGWWTLNRLPKATKCFLYYYRPIRCIRPCHR